MRKEMLLAGLIAALAAVPVGAAAEEAPGAGAAFSAQSGAPVRNGTPKPPRVPDDVVWFVYPVTLKETTGRGGVKVLGYRKCYEGGETFRKACDEVRTDIARLYGADTIAPGGTLTLKRPAWVWSEATGKTITVTVTYYAEDDRGRPLEAAYAFDVVAK